MLRALVIKEQKRIIEREDLTRLVIRGDVPGQATEFPPSFRGFHERARLAVIKSLVDLSQSFLNRVCAGDDSFFFFFFSYVLFESSIQFFNEIIDNNICVNRFSNYETKGKGV